MPAISRWLPASYSESFRENQVAVWFCAARYPLGNCTLSSGHNLQEMANSSRFAMFKEFSLKFVSGSRAIVKWKPVHGHYKCAQNDMPWRTQLYPDPSVDLFHYYLAFNGSFYQSAYPLASMKDACVFIVYNLKGYKDQEIDNCLFSSGMGVGQRGVCFNPANRSRCGKRCLRIHGVDNPECFLEFAEWGALADPTAIDSWNVLAVWWRPSG